MIRQTIFHYKINEKLGGGVDPGAAQEKRPAGMLQVFFLTDIGKAVDRPITGVTGTAI